MSKWQFAILWVAAVLALLAAGALPAMADAPAAEGYRVVVADLDLQSASGVNTLYSRLQTAARVVCGFDQARGYAARRQARRCMSATLDAVVAELGRDRFRNSGDSSPNSPTLSASDRIASTVP
jgi:UrcA family protein